MPRVVHSAAEADSDLLLPMRHSCWGWGCTLVEQSTAYWGGGDWLAPTGGHCCPFPNPPPLLARHNGAMMTGKHSPVPTPTPNGEGSCVQSIPVASHSKGHQWSGCSVRIRLQLRLPHSFHHLLSIVAPPAHSVSPACSACSLAEWWLRPSGLYWVRRTSWSVVTPSPGAIASWLPFGPPRFRLVVGP